MTRDLFIAAPARTPIGRYGGSLATVPAVDLGIAAVHGVLARAGISADAVDQLVFGHARQAGCGPNAARQVSVRAGIPVERPAYAINQACLSGLQAILAAARAIALGEAEAVVAGGM